ncbi:carbon monoxide dehydrogenase subunit G [Salipiger sp. P9]|uniref:CoxG family protein n=1 Tax=Salipiger pentaromativorans TaxID=2943193 RepID=UPI0021583291|nr:carbon monoxide dehydrogenase subunit G [Salipiger pentaromativorans]MCR8549224.1 carbon monoxide dehydrogenase subunit G [Salipiger pentaromativorans]
MEFTDTRLIAAPRAVVWEALNDPEVLRDCIPGCKELEMQSETEMSATVTTKIGPISATFRGNVTLSDLKPLETYVITGEGKGGIAGFASGQARIVLKEEGAQTELSYVAEVSVGGKLAQLGGRLIQSTARKLSGQFFEHFAQAAEARAAAEV